MLFKDFNGAIKLIERFLNPDLVEKLKNSTKEEDKVEYEKSVMYNKIINKIMPLAMIKVFLEKGTSILKLILLVKKKWKNLVFIYQIC